MEVEAPRASFGALPLIAIACGAFIFAHDFVAVGIAIPEIQAEFGTALGTAQWAITGFSIAIAIAVVPAGRFADIFGPANTFVIGAFGFAAASGLVAIAPEVWVVLAGRALQGIGAGVMWISAIPLVFTAFGPGRAGPAGAFLIGIAGIGTALGPIDAGLLIEWLGWRAAFAFNIPFCIFAGLVMMRHRSLGVAGAERAIDWTGIGVLAASLVILLVTLRYAPEWGWVSARAIAGFGAAAALMAAFALQQRAKGSGALIPPDIRANRRFAVSFAGEALLGMSYFAVVGLAPQIFANVLGVDSIEAGLMLAPSMAAFAVAAAVTGHFNRDLPAQILVPAVGAIAALGGLLLALMPDDPSYLSMLPGLLLVGAGTGGVFSSLVSFGVGSLPEERGGIAGGLLYMSQLSGGAIGLGAITAVVTEVAAGVAVEDFPGAALVQGVQSGFLLAAAFGAVGVLVVLFGYGVYARRAASAEPA